MIQWEKVELGIVNVVVDVVTSAELFWKLRYFDSLFITKFIKSTIGFCLRYTICGVIVKVSMTFDTDVIVNKKITRRT